MHGVGPESMREKCEERHSFLLEDFPIPLWQHIAHVLPSLLSSRQPMFLLGAIETGRREARWGKGQELSCLTACRRGFANIQNELFLSCNACVCSVDTPFLSWLGFLLCSSFVPVECSCLCSLQSQAWWPTSASVS